MNRFVKLCFYAGLVCLLITGCDQKTPPESKPPADTKKVMEPAHGGPASAPHQMGGETGMGKTPKQVVVPDDIKDKWKTLSILVTDKTSGKAVSYEVKPNSEFEVPDTSLKLIVGAFLPDFSMGGQEITSASSVPNNPALQIVIQERGEEKYSGWLFSKFVGMHAFEHEKYSVILEDKFGAETGNI